ncbi:MAG: hypothetical protein ACKVX7_11940 [Planctomycetota bacterium]
MNKACIARQRASGLRRRIRRLVCCGFASLVVVAGCGGGGGGSGGSAGSSVPVSVSALTVTPDLVSTSIRFTLVSPQNHRVTVAVSVSENRGLTYAPLTVASGSTSGLAATAAGAEFVLTWSPAADLGSTDQSDLRIRIVPQNEVTGSTGTASSSDVFSLGTNLPPVVVSVSTPGVLVGGEIDFTYDVSDAQADMVALTLEYSTDSGATWATASAGVAGDGVSNVTTSVSGVAHTVSWAAQADANGLVSASVLFRITPIDVIAGTAGQSGVFSVNLTAPNLVLLTIGDIPVEMNGSLTYSDSTGGPYNFRLSVPLTGTRLAVEYAAVGGGSALDVASLTVTGDRLLGGSVSAGSNLAPEFDPQASAGAWDIGSSHALPTGSVTFEAAIADTLGNWSSAESLPLNAVTADSASRPFDTADVWWLDFDGDRFSYSFVTGATVTITSSVGANGTVDYLEDLWILGLRTHSPTAECVTLNSNSILLNWAKAETVGRLNVLFGRDFDGTGAGFNSQLTFSLSSSGTSSSIRVGGDDQNAGYTLGRAEYDYRNAAGNSNRSTILGVFVTNLIQAHINSSVTFIVRFSPLIPGRGTPAGEGAIDHVVLDPSFDRLDPGNSIAENDRYDEIYAAIDALARSTAVILAHEIGHSVGLVANGAPPTGLFGGVTGASFSGADTTSLHLDSPGNNIMAAALGFSTSLITGSSAYHFNELNEAYLREWILLKQ